MSHITYQSIDDFVELGLVKIILSEEQSGTQTQLFDKHTIKPF